MGQYNATSRCNYSGEVHLTFICKEQKHLLRGEIQPWMQEEIHRIASIPESGIDTMESDRDHSHILLNYEPETSASSIGAGVPSTEGMAPPPKEGMKSA